MPAASLAQRSARPALALLLGLGAAACNARGDSPLAHAEERDEALLQVPTPPENGPKLVALTAGVKVLDRPSPKGKTLGELLMGAAVARSNEPYGKDDCKGGFYAVRPRGFVCADSARVALDPQSAKALPPLPDLTRPLPYRYARARMENVPIYARAPNPAEQAMTELDLTRLLRQKPDASPLGSFANDVPLDDRGVPTGPPVLLAGGDGVEDSRRTTASYFRFAADAQTPPSAGAELKAGALRKGSGIALAGALSIECAAGPRRFGITPAGSLVPIDRLRPALASARHGIDLDKLGLPVAFVHRSGAVSYEMEGSKAVATDDEFERRTPIPLTGRFRTVDGARFEETREGTWMRAQDLVVIVRRHKFPDFVKGQQKWLDVSVANQTLTAYEGTKPMYAALISSGRETLKESSTDGASARGALRVRRKLVTRALDSREVQGDFDVGDAPWVMELDGGRSIAGMYWSGNVGEARGARDIALLPIDARRIFLWAEPMLPDGFQSVEAGEGEGTIVSLRP